MIQFYSNTPGDLAFGNARASAGARCAVRLLHSPPGPCSSVGQSDRLLTDRSQFQVLPGVLRPGMVSNNI